LFFFVFFERVGFFFFFFYTSRSLKWVPSGTQNRVPRHFFYLIKSNSYDKVKMLI